MAITIRPLHALFCAEIDGVDTGESMDDGVFAEIRAAFEEYSVLVFRDQSLDDARQIAFSQRFGPLETLGKANPATGTHFARQSNTVRSGRCRRCARCYRHASCRRRAAIPNSPACAQRTTRCPTT